MKQHWRFLLPIALLALAALACSQISTPGIVAVMADADTPGTAYAFLGTLCVGNMGDDSSRIYETQDYGTTWRPLDRPLDTVNWATSQPAYLVTERQASVRIDNETVWTLPRQTFRSTVLLDWGCRTRFAPEHTDTLDYTISPADASTIYIAAGTEGVLVGPAPGTNVQPWALGASGMAEVTPTQLAYNLDEYFPIGGLLLAAAIVFLPASAIHAWSVRQVWRWCLPKEKTPALRRVANRVLFLATFLIALVAATVWLCSAQLEYQGIIAAIALVAVGTTTAITVLLGYLADYPLGTTVAASLGAAIVTPVIPAILFTSWGNIFPLTAIAVPVIAAVDFFRWRRTKIKRQQLYEFDDLDLYELPWDPESTLPPED